jgi:hypothetical protein
VCLIKTSDDTLGIYFLPKIIESAVPLNLLTAGISFSDMNSVQVCWIPNYMKLNTEKLPLRRSVGKVTCRVVNYLWTQFVLVIGFIGRFNTKLVATFYKSLSHTD